MERGSIMHRSPRGDKGVSRSQGTNRALDRQHQHQAPYTLTNDRMCKHQDWLYGNKPHLTQYARSSSVICAINSSVRALPSKNDFVSLRMQSFFEASEYVRALSNAIYLIIAD